MAHQRRTKMRNAARARARTCTESAPNAASAAANMNGANFLMFSAAIARARQGGAYPCIGRDAKARASETSSAATMEKAKTKRRAPLLSFVQTL